ncbi:MAG: hypothetical protein LUE16_03880, partial [Lachnospiraceae bacterium]|nr:hypothetical protein [Lachnospiraceae bacterium]
NISSEEYVVFEYEQQTWLNEMKSQLSQKLSNYSVNNIDEVQNSDIYIEFGNIIVRRILKLINTYYGWNYYE